MSYSRGGSRIKYSQIVGTLKQLSTALLQQSIALDHTDLSTFAFVFLKSFTNIFNNGVDLYEALNGKVVSIVFQSVVPISDELDTE